MWDRLDGQPLLFVVTSFAGMPRTAAGRRIDALGEPKPAAIESWPGGGVWMEAIVPDVDDTWYGYYHNEHYVELPSIRLLGPLVAPEVARHVLLPLAASPAKYDVRYLRRKFR